MTNSEINNVYKIVYGIVRFLDFVSSSPPPLPAASTASRDPDPDRRGLATLSTHRAHRSRTSPAPLVPPPAPDMRLPGTTPTARDMPGSQPSPTRTRQERLPASDETGTRCSGRRRLLQTSGQTGCRVWGFRARPSLGFSGSSFGERSGEPKGRAAGGWPGEGVRVPGRARIG